MPLLHHNRLRTHHHEVVVPGLDPRLDGFRVVQLSDIHCGRVTPAEHVRQAVALANAARPDLVVLTGDYVCWTVAEAELVREQLAGLVTPRIVAVLGNHDYFTSPREVTRALNDIGAEVLFNTHTLIEHNGAQIPLVGIDDPVTRHDDLDTAFHRVGDGPRLVLCHGPETADDISRHGGGVIFSGHTHGGQVFLRGITDRLIERFGMRYRSGFYGVENTSQLYVSSGVGFSGVRMRYGHGTEAEVAAFVLRSPEVVLGNLAWAS